VKRLGIVAKTDREEARTVVPQLLEWCAAGGGDGGGSEGGGVS